MNNNYFIFKKSWMLQQLIFSSFSYGQIKVIKSSFLILFILLLTTTKGFSQCAYTGTPLTQVGGDYTFCIDNGQTYTTATVNGGQYVVVNVVKGFNYTFSVGDVFAGDGNNETLTLYNGSTYVGSPVGNVGFASTLAGAALNWTATFSGKVKVLLSKGACLNDGSAGGSLTLKLNSIGNSLDDQTLAGTDKWVGHVYNLSTTTIPPGGTSPATPSALYPFTTANYVGFYNTASETISENFGGNAVCFPVTSASTSIYTETFAVRYRMKSTKTAGYYFLNVSGDDGVRVYVDGALVFNEWKEQSEIAYCNNLIYLNGSSTIVLDYYENGGQNVVKFSLTPVSSASANAISGASSYNVCSGTSPGTLAANIYASPCATSSIPNITYQWQVSPDNATWNDIVTGGGTKDYTVPATTPATNTTLYYRRLVKSKGANDPNGGIISNVITVNTSAATVGGTVSGGTTVCSGSTSAVLTLSGQTGSVVRWESSVSPFAVWTPIANTNTTYTSTALTQTTQFRAVVQSGVCGTSTSAVTTVTVNPSSVGGSVNGGTTICSGSGSAVLTLSGHTGTVVRWESSVSPFTAWTSIANTNTTYTSAALTQTTQFRAVVQSGACAEANSAPTTVTVNPALVASVTISSNVGTTICAGTSVTFTATPTNGGTPTYQWKNGTINVGTNSPTFTSNILNNGEKITVVMTSNATPCLSGSPATSNVLTMAVNPVTVGGSVSGAKTICSGSNSGVLTLSGHTGTVVRWESAISPFSSWTPIANTSTTYTSSALSQTTQFKAVVQSGTCGIANSEFITITVNPNLPASVIISANPETTICSGTSVTFAATPTNGGTAPSYQWKNGGVDIATATGSTYTTTGLVNYDAITVVMISNATPCLTGSPATSNTITMVVTPTNSLTLTSASITNNQTICFNTAINPITYTTTGATGISNNGVSGANGLPAGVSASWASNTITISGITTVSGKFNYTIPLTGGCGTNNATGTITVGANSTYNGVKWDSGIPNNNGFNAVIEGSYDTSLGNVNACNCDVKSTGTLTISNGTTVTVQNNITNNGILTVKEGGNLIQKNNAGVNQGDINVEKLFTFIMPTAPIAHRQQYNYVISPVIGQILKTIYSGTPTTLYYNEATNYFGTSTGAYIAGRGLAIKEPSEEAVSTSTVTAQFKGVPFNGILEYPLAYTASATSLYGYNMVGNPYPSNLDLQLLYDYANGSDKNADKIEPTFQFWDNRGNLQFTQQGSGYSGDSYAKYNVLSGTGVASASAATNSPISDKRIPNQYVQVGTGFMVRALSSAIAKKLVFNNDMRTDNKGKSYLGKQSEKDRYWLTLKTPSAMELMNAVVYFEGGSNAFGLEDSKASGSSDGIYSMVDNYKLAIQGRATFADTDKVEVGLSLFTAGSYTISLLDTDGVFANGQDIYLKDKQAGIIADLSLGSYTFNSTAGESTGRFEIIYKPETVLATDAQTKEELVVYKDQGDFVIKARTKKITGVEVYETGGRLIYMVQPNSTKAVIPADRLVNGVYVLKINQNGQITSKKIIR